MTRTEFLALQAARYEYVRTLNVSQFKEIFLENLQGVHTFDELVDNGIKERNDSKV